LEEGITERWEEEEIPSPWLEEPAVPTTVTVAGGGRE
jgi:hypothetical protein